MVRQNATEDGTFDSIDLSQYKTAHGAAKAAARKLRSIAEASGHKPDVEVVVKKRGSGDGRLGTRWCVYYEAGPYEWAIRLTGGATVWGGDEPVLTGLYDNDGWMVECENASGLAFHPQ